MDASVRHFTYSTWSREIIARAPNLAPELARWVPSWPDQPIAISAQEARDLCHILSAEAQGLRESEPEVSRTAARAAAQLMLAQSLYERDHPQVVAS